MENETLKIIIDIGKYVVPILLFMIIKFNDLKHISKGIKEIKDDIKCHYKTLGIHGERISKIEGKMNGK